MDERTSTNHGASDRRSLRVGARRVGARRAAGLAVALALAAVALLALPTAKPTQGIAATAEPILIGEHSALGPRQVEVRNQALASIPYPRGEHAGISRTDNEAESH